MIEYANESIIKLLKQYDMLSKTLRFTNDIKQKNDICYQMTKIIQNVLETTNAIYEEKYNTVAKRSVYLMDEEKNRLLELINLINERRVYVNNQIINNKEITGISLDTGMITGEDKLEEYKTQVKIIERYKNNIRLEGILKEEITSLDASIKKANAKINHNQQLNKQLEDKMIKILENAFAKLSLYELQEREKEIDLAYTELGYSLEKAKENAKIARRDCAEEIILECDNMLASITLEYERYKEKKLILKLINSFKNPVNNYNELLTKREEINSILTNITSSELYSIVGNELNKQYATIKLEKQDVATLKSLMEEKDIKTQTLKEIKEENSSDEFKGLLSNLLENEKRHQERIILEKKRAEQKRLEKEKEEEKKKLEEMAKRQKALEEERKKEIERRTKQLLVEKKNPVLMPTKEQIFKEEISEKEEVIEPTENTTKIDNTPKSTNNFIHSMSRLENRHSNIQEKEKDHDLISPRTEGEKNFPSQPLDDLFTRDNKNKKIVDQGIPVIKSSNLGNEVLTAKKGIEKEKKVFPDIPLEKKETIFPDLPNSNKNNSFFDENEFNDLKNYMEKDDKTNWF